VAIAGTWRMGTRERISAAIGVIYAVIPSAHEDWGGGFSLMEAR
jgi:hypothetical protein